MKKILLSLIIALPICSSVYAQTIHTFHGTPGGGTFSSSNLNAMSDQKKLDEAYLECIYDYTYLKDTVDLTGKPSTDAMVLQIGNKISKFYSYRTYQVDSLIANVSSPDEVMSNIAKFRKGESFEIYKNYPEGKLTYMDKLVRDNFKYEEDNYAQQWTMGEREKNIEGYNCREAVCKFRGRNYTAWFTTEIPISNGPWKFGGLPGLILEVSDDAGQYSFLLKGIKKVENQPINIPDIQYQKVKREKYLETLRTFLEDPISYMQMTSGVKMTIRKADGSPMTEEMTRKELKYDLIERE